MCPKTNPIRDGDTQNNHLLDSLDASDGWREEMSDVAARRALRSTARGELLVPRARLAIKQRRAFSVVGPSIGDDLPLKLRSLLVSHPAEFYKSLKSFFFSRGWAGSASE